MPFLLLIMEERNRRGKRSAEEKRLERDRMEGFAEELKRRGVYKTSESLRSAGGARIALRHGKHVVSDGPFAEAKEIVGGFFLLDCANREQAIAIASECPAAAWSTVEVREVGPCTDD
jgi:hypothetical protein